MNAEYELIKMYLEFFSFTGELCSNNIGSFVISRFGSISVFILELILKWGFAELVGVECRKKI